MVLKKFLDPMNLAKAQTFYIYKLTEIIIGNKNDDLIFTLF